MNFYKRHIGDYIKDAGHLSLLEHGVYCRLLDVYYTREAGIPDDKAARLIGARGKDEQQALQNVLDEFFTLVDGHWIQDRCEREIQVANAKAVKNRENGSKGGRPKKKETESQTEENPNGLLVGNHVGSKNNLSQTPDTRHQTPDTRLEVNTALSTSTGVGPGNSKSARPSPGEISKAMRAKGVMSQPDDPRILALVEQGVSVGTVTAACDAARSAKPNESIGVGYVVAILKRWSEEAAAMQVQGARAPVPQQQSVSRDEQNRQANEEAKRIVLAAYPNDPEAADATS